MNQQQPQSAPGQTVGDPVIANVHSHNDPDPTKQFTIDWHFQGMPSQGETPINLPFKSGSHDITFILHDDAGLGVKFKQTWTDAFWAHEGTDCPKKAGLGGQFPGGSVTPDRMQLTVTDSNHGNACNMHYMLRFDPDPYCMDPIIQNGGGGNKSFSHLLVGAVIIGAALIATVAYLARH